VFDAVRGRIISGDTFDTEPAGIAGLTVLVRTHPALQNNLIDFLESLPSDRCGAWPASGWDAALTDPTIAARFKRLVEHWATSAKSTPLKVAASNALKLPRTRRA
jgi:hypothetical protein